MYLRRTQRRNKDGSVVRYVAVAHNHREGGKTRADVLLNLGREDRLDVDGLRRLVGSICRYLGDEAPSQATAGRDHGGSWHDQELRVVSSKQLGVAWLLDELWRRLGIADALKAVVGGGRFTTDMERALFALVAHRASDPSYRLAPAEWASHAVAIAGLEAMGEEQACRAMSLLAEADRTGEVQRAVFFAVADVLELEVDLLLFDTTSTSFEGADEEPGGGDWGFGSSKDHQAGRVQTVFGLAVTREGIPVRVWTWPGNTDEHQVLPQIEDDLRGWQLGRVVTVVDRRLSSDKGLAHLRRAGGHWIAGEHMRDGKADHLVALSQTGRYQPVRDNLQIEEVRLDGEGGRRVVVCHNPVEAENDRARREDTIARLEAELERIAAARAYTTQNENGQRRDAENAAHTRAERALLEHPSLGHYLRQRRNGRLRIDRAKVSAAERLDGKFLLSTSDPDLRAEDVALGYKNLLEAQRGFRHLLPSLEQRPAPDRLPHRAHADALLSWLALLIVRVAERSTGHTWRRIALTLGRVHEVTLEGNTGVVIRASELTDLQRHLLHACHIEPPARITDLSPG